MKDGTKEAIDLMIDSMMICGEGSFLEGVLFGINYIIAGHPDLYDEYGEVTKKDLSDWGLKDVIDEANKKTRQDFLKKYKKIIQIVK